MWRLFQTWSTLDNSGVVSAVEVWFLLADGWWSLDHGLQFWSMKGTVSARRCFLYRKCINFSISSCSSLVIFDILRIWYPSTRCRARISELPEDLDNCSLFGGQTVPRTMSQQVVWFLFDGSGLPNAMLASLRAWLKAIQDLQTPPSKTSSESPWDIMMYMQSYCWWSRGRKCTR